MRRPLFWVCLLLSVVSCLRFWLTGGFDPGGGAGEAPDPQEQAVFAGRVCGRETGDQTDVFLIQIDFSKTNSLAAVSQRTLSYLSQKHTKKLRCYPEEACEALPEIGSRVIVRGDFSAYDGACNPGEFDAEKYNRGNGIGGRLKNTVILQKSGEYDKIGEALLGLRAFLAGRLDAMFPEREAGVIKTMLLGDRSGLDSELKELYRGAGIIHILSISGLHITLLGMGVYRLLRKFGAAGGAAAVGGSVILVLYGAMTGMSVSACRAIGMFLLRMCSLLLGRTYDLLTALSVLCAGMLCADPGRLLNSGFWLSFGSLYGIGCILPVLEELAEERGRPEGRAARAAEAVFESLRGGTAVVLATLPLQLHFSYEIPVYATAVNLLVIPCMGFVAGCGFLAMLTGIPVFAGADTIVLKGFELLCRAAEKLPFHTWNPGAPKLWQTGLYYLCLSALLLGAVRYKRMRERRQSRAVPAGYLEKPGERGGLRRIRPWEILWRRAVKWCVFFLPVVLFALPVRRMSGVTFLDVGQGDAICIRARDGQTWICDCGSTGKSRVGEKILLPYLKREGIRRINGVFLSHEDQDHVSGLTELFAAAGEGEIRIDRVILPAGEAEERAGGRKAAEGDAKESFAEEIKRLGEQGLFEVVSVKAGDRIQSGALSFLVLNPDDGGAMASGSGRKTGDQNAASLCLLACVGQGKERLRVLLTGDAEGSGERRMAEELRRQGVSHVDVLKCAHHGSKNATSQEFLGCVRAQLTVISCGRGNAYGHPHEETLRRLWESGTTIFRTDECGAVTVRLGRGKVRVETWLK